MRKIRSIHVALAATMVLSAATAALAEEHDDPITSEDGNVTYDPTVGSVLVAIGEIGEEADCSLVEPIRDDVTGELSSVLPLPDDCLLFDAQRPNGQSNHGSVVSAVARNLDPQSLDGRPKGHVMREVASLKLPKPGNDEATAEVEAADAEDGEPQGNAHGWGRGRGRGRNK